MCLVRIDYNAMKPQGQIEAYKVFKLYSDGLLVNAFKRSYGREPVVLGQWQEEVSPKQIVKSKWRRGSLAYDSGFHAGHLNCAQDLAEYMNKASVGKYKRLHQLQLDSMKYRVWHDYSTGKDSRYWLDSARSPLDVTVQEPHFTYVVRRVLLRGVHTVGRQRLNYRTYRTWVASEQLVPEVN